MKAGVWAMVKSEDDRVERAWLVEVFHGDLGADSEVVMAKTRSGARYAYWIGHELDDFYESFLDFAKACKARLHKRDGLGFVQLERMRKANDLIAYISKLGRKFLGGSVGEKVASRFVCENGLLFIDSYSGERLHVPKLKGFNGGGTMKDLIFRLSNYITDDVRLSYVGGSHWAYGDDMPKVHKYAVDMGICEDRPYQDW